MPNIIKLSPSKSIALITAAGGSVPASEKVEIPLGYVGILSPRRTYGEQGIMATSQFLEGGFSGYPELHLFNRGNFIEISKGTELVNLVIVKGLNDA